MIDKDKVRQLTKWPRWPYLPLKQLGGTKLAALYAEYDGEPPNEAFFFKEDANVFTLHPVEGLSWTDRKTLDQLEAEGWVVD